MEPGTWIQSALIFAIVFLIAKFITRRNRLKLPGPFQLPFIGNALQIKMSAPHQTFTQWEKKYGPLFQVNIIL